MSALFNFILLTLFLHDMFISCHEYFPCKMYKIIELFILPTMNIIIVTCCIFYCRLYLCCT